MEAPGLVADAPRQTIFIGSESTPRRCSSRVGKIVLVYVVGER